MNQVMNRDWRQDDEMTLLDYWRLVRKRARLVLGLPLVSVLLVGPYTYFLAPKIFESTASVLSPAESGGGGASLAAAIAASGAGQMLGGLLSGAGTSRDTFEAILKSRTMAQELVDRFKLKEYYHTEFAARAISKLQAATTISVSREGVISVKVEDTDPKRAADLANGYVANLDRMFAKLGTTNAGRQRAFIAQRLDKTEKALRQAEDALKHFQETNRAIVLQEQSVRAIEAAAQVKGQIAAAEVQLEVMRGFATENNPQVTQQKRQIEEMKRQLAQMQYSQGLDLPAESNNPGQPRKEFQIPFTKVPELERDLIRLTRDVKVQETVFTLLTQQFEQAKIAEARDTPTVQVLDYAVPAEFKSKPSTRWNMEIAGALSLIVGLFLAFFLEYLERIRKRESAAGLQ
jgi:tyrosine-protein kinase Etk/Wzc